MALLLIDASPIEFGVFEEQWDAVMADLLEAGHEVRVKDRDEIRTQLPPSLGLPPTDIPDAETIRIVVHVARQLAAESLEEAVGAVVAAVTLHL